MQKSNTKKKRGVENEKKVEEAKKRQAKKTNSATQDRATKLKKKQEQCFKTWFTFMILVIS